MMQQPEENLFTYLTVGQTLQRVLTIYTNSFHVRMFLMLTAVVLVPLTALLMIITSAIVTTMIGTVDYEDPSFIINNVSAFIVLSAVRVFVTTAVGVVANAAMMRAVGEIYVGRNPGWWDCLMATFRRIMPLVIAAILVFAGVVLGYSLLILPGIYVAISWFGTTPAITIEGKTAVGGMKRSWDLSTGGRLYILACYIVVAVINSIIVFIINAVLLGGNSTYLHFSAIGSFVQMIPAVAFYPAYAILTTVIYINLRVGREGLTADILAHDLATSGGGSAIGVSDYRQLPLIDGSDDVAIKSSEMSAEAGDDVI